ncbi:site-specific integrase [Gordonia alkanivorans]|uniref:tyrosine-type recombinase/integrase n=1 Tax=Gordonia alkanivorans TaxID=84096 RepID=UPI001F4E817F|nr:site-specific integrase [Gordonia alkanivorans]MDH3026839.1 site-specific integrase [Gordonia alkanivorans]
MAGKPGRRGWGYIRKLPSGRFQASYIGDDLRRHKAPRTFTAKMDAEAWLAMERRKLEIGTWEAPTRPVPVLDLATYAERWVSERKLRPRTATGYRALLRLHINPTLGDKTVATITPEMVRRWYIGLGTDHPTRNTHAYQLLHAVMATAVTDDLIPANPVHIRGAMHAERKRQPVILTPNEVGLLAEEMPAELAASVLLAAWCGLRWGETSELRRKDLDLDGAVLTVARGVTYRDKTFRVQGTKSGVVRRVVMPPHIVERVRDHLANHVGADPDSLLFPAPGTETHLVDVLYRKSFTKAASAIGRAGLHVHDLRHFAGTQAARVGGTTAEVMARLGHSTVGAAMKYQASDLKRDRQIAAALSELARGDEKP